MLHLTAFVKDIFFEIEVPEIPLASGCKKVPDFSDAEIHLAGTEVALNEVLKTSVVVDILEDAERNFLRGSA